MSHEDEAEARESMCLDRERPGGLGTSFESQGQLSKAVVLNEEVRVAIPTPPRGYLAVSGGIFSCHSLEFTTGIWGRGQGC